jgi:hypothetical protein
MICYHTNFDSPRLKTLHAMPYDHIVLYWNFILVGCILLRNVHVRIFQTYTRNRNREILLMLLYLSVSQHVSAPTGHPQVNTITIFKTSLRKLSLSQRIRCS